jgi:hypothetical protein
MRWHPSIHALPLAALMAVATAALSSCAGNAPGETHVYVIDELRILVSPEIVDGVPIVDGFDIDGVDGPPPGGNCRAMNQADYVAPDGRTGIDNQLAGGGLATVVRLLAEQEEDSSALFEGLVQGAVTAGTLLVLLQFDDVNSFVNDDHVTMTLLLGQPFNVGVGTDGRLLAGQSFDIRADTEPVVVETRIRDGVLLAQGVELELTGSILDVEFEIPITLGQLRVEFNPNGTVTGVLGGALPWNTIADVIPRIGGAAQFATLGRRILGGIADIMNFETGECDRLSASIRVHGVPAFILDESPPAVADASVP